MLTRREVLQTAALALPGVAALAGLAKAEPVVAHPLRFRNIDPGLPDRAQVWLHLGQTVVPEIRFLDFPNVVIRGRLNADSPLWMDATHIELNGRLMPFPVPCVGHVEICDAAVDAEFMREPVLARIKVRSRGADSRRGYIITVPV